MSRHMTSNNGRLCSERRFYKKWGGVVLGELGRGAAKDHARTKVKTYGGARREGLFEIIPA